MKTRKYRKKGGAALVDINVIEEYGETPFINALREGRLDYLETMLKDDRLDPHKNLNAKTEKDLRNSIGLLTQSPINSQEHHILKLIVNHKNFDFNKILNANGSPIMCDIVDEKMSSIGYGGGYDILQMILDSHYDPNKTIHPSGRPLFFEVCSLSAQLYEQAGEKLDIFEIFLKSEKINLKQKDRDGDTVIDALYKELSVQKETLENELDEEDLVIVLEPYKKMLDILILIKKSKAMTKQIKLKKCLSSTHSEPEWKKMKPVTTCPCPKKSRNQSKSKSPGECNFFTLNKESNARIIDQYNTVNDEYAGNEGEITNWLEAREIENPLLGVSPPPRSPPRNRPPPPGAWWIQPPPAPDVGEGKKRRKKQTKGKKKGKKQTRGKKANKR